MPQMSQLDELGHSCPDKVVGQRVAAAIAQLFANDLALFRIDAAERAIAGQLMAHLRPQFPDWHVDVEYNRMGDGPKEVAWNENPERVYPDIIVHVRETHSNLLAIELKKSSNRESKHDDVKKLVAYKHDGRLSYKQCLFVRFGVKEQAGTVVECEWV
jgi:hypothetical protein